MLRQLRSHTLAHTQINTDRYLHLHYHILSHTSSYHTSAKMYTASCTHIRQCVLIDTGMQECVAVLTCSQ
ncbi:hypothetical protein COCON_G00115140 [Conger conger]|uniref:Uncharacterized protein n=1 Tax=Conger conger TaxID=82655 RepID=A0A9Q1DFN3_CONCO|nr:hypothetical protein COCON_G00115140 [Conger conger]